jgi:protein ImuA
MLTSAAPALSTGCEAFNELFPARGIWPGSLVEWLEGDARGATTVSLAVARNVCPSRRPLILIDSQHELFPLALKGLGFDLSRVVVIRPTSGQEAFWACEEALRCPGVGLVWAPLVNLHVTGFRRLQLAAEASQGVGFLLRSAQAARQPSWAESRLRVDPRPSSPDGPQFRVEVAYSQGSTRRSMLDITLGSLRGTIHEVSHPLPTQPLPLVYGMADAAPSGVAAPLGAKPVAVDRADIARRIRPPCE